MFDLPPMLLPFVLLPALGALGALTGAFIGRETLIWDRRTVCLFGLAIVLAVSAFGIAAYLDALMPR